MNPQAIVASRWLGKPKAMLVFALMESSDRGGCAVTLSAPTRRQVVCLRDSLMDLMTAADIQPEEVVATAEQSLIIVWRGTKMTDERKDNILDNLRYGKGQNLRTKEDGFNE